MEEISAAPRRERRHRKAAAQAGAAGGGAAAAARAAYGDVFGGPPRFAAPFAGVPEDYAEVFGGVAASCSIPFLDLPPAAGGDGGGGGAGDYGEIFGLFDFGDFAVPYEELFADAGRVEEEIASSSGSSRSSIKQGSIQLEAESSILYQHYPNVGHDQQFEEDQFSPTSFPSDGQQHFSMSYNKTTWGRPDDLIETTTCIVEPSIGYVVDSCNLSHDSTTNNVPIMDNGIMANGDKGKSSPLNSNSASVKSSNSDPLATEKQHMPTCPAISENVSANENDQKSSNSHSASSEEASSRDYPFLRVSDISLHTRSIKVPPPSRPPPKLLNKKETTAKGDIHTVNHKGTPTTSAHAIANSSMLHTDRRANAPFDPEANPSSAAAAAMKEAMEFAEARLKAAKELMERTGDSFKLRRRPGHHRSTKSTEIKETKTEVVHSFEEELSAKKSAKEEKNHEDLALLDKNREVSAVKLAHCDDDQKKVLPLEKPQEIIQSGFISFQASNKLEKLDKWRSGDEFYELISDDRKCNTNAASREEDNVERTNLSTKLGQDGQGKTGVTVGDSAFDKYEKLWEDNESRKLGAKHVNLKEDGTASMVIEDKAPVVPDAFIAENSAHQEICDSHIQGHERAGHSQEIYNYDEGVQIPCASEIPPKLDVVQEMSGLFSEACTSGDHVSDNRDLDVAITKESPVVGMSQNDNNKERLEMPCVNETPCTSETNKKLQEHPDASNIDDFESGQVKVAKLEETAEYYDSQDFQPGSCTVDGEPGTYAKEKMFSSVDEACLRDENEKVIEVSPEALTYGVEKFGTNMQGSPCESSEETLVDLDAVCPEKENDITSESAILANENEETEVSNVFELSSKLVEGNSRECDILDKDTDQLQEMQGSLEPQELENRTAGAEDLVRHRKEKEALLEGREKTAVEGILNNGSMKDQIATGSNKGLNKVYAEGNVAIGGEDNVARYGAEGITDTDSYYVTRMSTNPNDLQASSSEMCTSTQHLFQCAESVSAQVSDKTNPDPVNPEEDCREEAERELPTEESAISKDEEKMGNKMEGREDKMPNVELKDQQSLHLERITSIPKFAEDTASSFVKASTKEASNVHRIEEMENWKQIEREVEKEKEVLRRLEEEKERERKLDKEKEQAKEEKRKIEEKEREREREKDRLAVERATREAHERAFAEARERAERIALERITAARQRASAEAREKEEKASAEAAAEKAAREARIKTERAAVERATAEARERAIEKAKAEKAAANARERMERYRSSFKESFMTSDQDIRPDTRFRRASSDNYGRSTDSCNQVVEVESALRHKAKLERHQRTAERAAKALAEKNLRDLLAQREQAERHRLAEFLDPEVKRWSNGKEGNLRALLSTLQYILGADSGWQPVPLTDLITAAAVKKAYRRATLCVHPDKLQQRGATIRQKYICEKVFDLLKEAWNKFNSEER